MELLAIFYAIALWSIQMSHLFNFGYLSLMSYGYSSGQKCALYIFVPSRGQEGTS